MELRSEPRFHVNASGHVVRLNANQEEVACQLLDISAKGMRAIVDAPLAPGEIVLVELEDHSIICEARYVEPRGPKYAAGLFRWHEMERSGLPEARADRIAVMIKELQALLIAENIEIPEHFHAIARSVGVPAPAAAEALEVKADAPTTTQAPEPVPAAQTNAVEPAAVPDSKPVVRAEESKAVPTSRPAETSGAAPRRSRMMLAVAASFVIAIVLGFGVLHSRTSATAAPPTPTPVVAKTPTPEPPVAKPVESIPAEPKPVESKPVEPKPAEPKPVAAKPVEPKQPEQVRPSAAGAHHLEIRLSDTSWISVRVDGKPSFSKLFRSGDAPTVDFSDEALIHIGNAAAVELVRDGKSLGSMGGQKALRLVKVEANDLHFLPWQNEDPIQPAGK